MHASVASDYNALAQCRQFEPQQGVQNVRQTCSVKVHCSGPLAPKKEQTQEEGGKAHCFKDGQQIADQRDLR